MSQSKISVSGLLGRSLWEINTDENTTFYQTDYKTDFLSYDRYMTFEFTHIFILIFNVPNILDYILKTIWWIFLIFSVFKYFSKTIQFIAILEFYNDN